VGVSVEGLNGAGGLLDGFWDGFADWRLQAHTTRKRGTGSLTAVPVAHAWAPAVCWILNAASHG
jgi:hypothetical protein